MGRKRFLVHLDNEIYEKLHETKEDTGFSINSIIRYILKDYYDNNKTITVEITLNGKKN